MNWILQQPLVIIVVGLVAELILFLILQQTGKRSVLFAMVAVALLLVGAVALERFIVTPEEAVRAKLYEIAADAQRNDVDAVVAHISRRSPEKQSEARGIFKRVKLKEVSVKGIDDLQVGDPPERATVVVRVKAVGDVAMLENQIALREINVTLVLEDGVWKVREYDDLGDPLRP